MEGQQEWARKAAGSYQELARVFSSYVTDRQEETCSCGAVQEEVRSAAMPEGPLELLRQQGDRTHEATEDGPLS